MKKPVAQSIFNMISMFFIGFWVLGIGPIVFEKNGISRIEDFYFEKEGIENFRTSVVSNDYF